MLRVDGSALEEAASAAGGPRSFSRQAVPPRAGEGAAPASAGGAARSAVGDRRPARPADGEVLCSFAEHGEAFLEQRWYHCYTCGAQTNCGGLYPDNSQTLGPPRGSAGAPVTHVVCAQALKPLYSAFQEQVRY